MKKILIALSILLCHVSFSFAGDNAKDVLDKCAAKVSAKEGISANFTMESAQYGSASGTIAVKGRKFHAKTPIAVMWYDGATQWTWLEKNNEVSVTTPTETQQQAINPYNFINMYKKGFDYTMSTSGSSYVVHLTASDPKRKVQEMFITIDKNSYAPTEVKMRQGSKWTRFVISQLKVQNLSDSEFVFNSKDFPTAEVIDLR